MISPEIIKKNLHNFEKRYWSFINTIKVNDTKYFLKIPKKEWDSKIWVSVKKKENQEYAKKEFKNHKSFEKLEYTPNFKIVPLLDYISEYNCLIFEYIDGKRLYELTLRHNFVFNKKINSFFYDLGKNLKKIHEKVPVEKSTLNLFQKIQEDSADVGININKKIIEYAKTIKFDKSISVQGFEIRNFLIKDDQIYFFDLGELRRSFIYEDVARFIVSCYIIYWNSPLFFFSLKTKKKYIDSFLKGYNISFDDLNLNIFILRELIRQYKAALKVLNYKIKNKLIRYIIKKLYISKFYEKEIRICQRRILIMKKKPL